jgi:hypothetical protein
VPQELLNVPDVECEDVHLHERRVCL